MLILGTTSDDKGKQLEKLTQTLLETLGYENIVTNSIGSGGSEIDVKAEYSIPGLGAQRATHKLICECKAHNKPNDISDWLKFLGKIFCEEARTRQSVYGCFVALSGVNGNVWGNYEELKAYRDNVALISGVELQRIVTEKYNLCDLARVHDSVKRYTNRHFRDVETVYYEGEVYYVIVFEDDSYTLLRSNGDLFQGGHSEFIQKIVKDVMPVVEYVDLQQEAEARQREMMIQKSILSQLMINNGTLCIEKLASMCSEYTQAEIQDGISKLVERKWITKRAGNVALISDDQEDFYSLMVSVYRFLLSEEVNVQVLGGVYYDKYLNEKFVSEIQNIQGGISFSPEEIQKIVQLLRFSPGALVYAAYPDPMITVHRTQDISPLNAERVDANDRHYFLRNLYLCLLSNFELSGLIRYFLEVRGIVELETWQTIKAKSETGVVLQDELQHRLRITKLSDEFGGKYGLILLLNDTPEPWENGIRRTNSEEIGL